MNHFWISMGAMMGALGVILGAFGAHALKDSLDNYSLDIYQKAVFYQFIHAIALILTGLIQHQFQQLNLGIAQWSFFLGIIIFSGSLYILAVSGVKWMGAITPIGGVAFIVGWVWLSFKCLQIK